MADQANIFDRRRFHEGTPDDFAPPPTAEDPFLPYLSESFGEGPQADDGVFEPLFTANPAGATGGDENPEDADATSGEDGTAAAPPDGEPPVGEDGAADPASQEPGSDAEPSEQDAEPEPEKPVFDQEALDAARQAGFDEGREAGKAEAAEATESRSASALEQIATSLNEIAQDRTEEIAEAAADALAIGVAVVRKLFPTLRTKLADKEIRAFVTQRLGDAGGAQTLKVQVHDDLQESIGEHMAALSQQSGFAGTIAVQSEEDLAVGDVRLDWRDGGIERLYETLWTGIEAALVRSMGPLEPSAKAEAARPRKKRPVKNSPSADQPAASAGQQHAPSQSG